MSTLLNKMLYLVAIFLSLSPLLEAKDVSPVFNEEFLASNSNSVTELSENSFKGEILNNIVYKASDISKVNFNGLCTYAYMETENSGFVFNLKNKILFNSNSFTIGMWFKMNSYQSSPATFLEFVDSKNNSLIKVTSKSSSKKEKSGISVYVKNKSNGTIRRYVDNAESFRFNEWVYLSLTFNANNGILKIFINGSLSKKVKMPTGGINFNISKLYIGVSSDKNSGIYGNIDEIIMFDGILEDEKINEIYTNEKSYHNYDGTARKCINRVCTLKYIQGSDPISDVFGKTVFTKKTFTYDCVFLETKRGVCDATDSNITYKVPDENISGAYINTIEGGNIAQIGMIASAQSYASKIMSGWKGYCIKGTVEDMSWANDPYFWGSIALSTASGYLGQVGSKAGAAADAAKKTLADTAETSAREAAKKALKEALKKKLFAKLGEYAVCVGEAGMDLGQMMGQSDNIPCDPVDEICTPESRSYDGQTYTISETDYNDMLASDPESAKYITVKSRKDGQVTLLITYPEDALDKSDEAAKKAKEKARKQAQKIQGAMIALSAASCLGSTALGSGATNTSSSSGDKSSGPSAADMATSVAGMAAGAICGPLCSAGVQIVGKFATSFKNVNSCGKLSDATEQGSRHAATYKANQMGLCKEIKHDCKKGDGFGGCRLKERFYCCYDTALTKTLAEQVKAQLGISWSHCTGISLNEMMHIGFQSCNDKRGIDGAALPYDASLSQRQNAFQYKEKCIDYTDYINYVRQFTNGRFNKNDIQSVIDGNY